VCGYFLRMLHWRTFGQTRHSSDSGASSGRLFMSPEKWAHLAGESRTVGYPVVRMSMIFVPSVTMSSLDMQCGHA